jgi:hypothetical protein
VERRTPGWSTSTSAECAQTSDDCRRCASAPSTLEARARPPSAGELRSVSDGCMRVYARRACAGPRRREGACAGTRARRGGARGGRASCVADGRRKRSGACGAVAFHTGRPWRTR